MDENDQLTTERLSAACHKVAVEYDLSEMEETVLTYWATGYTKRFVADVLCLAESTIDSHAKKIYKKVGINDQPEQRAKDKLIVMIHSYY